MQLRELNIGDEFYAASDKKKVKRFRVLGKCTFCSGHGSSVRECSLLGAGQSKVSKSCNLAVVKATAPAKSLSERLQTEGNVIEYPMKVTEESVKELNEITGLDFSGAIGSEATITIRPTEETIAPMSEKILYINCEDGDSIGVTVENGGEVLIWLESNGEAISFSLEEWEKVSKFVLEKYIEMNAKR